MSKPAIPVTPTNLDQAESNKCIGYFLMSPLDFLLLTTDKDPKEWVKEEAPHTLTVEEYVQFQKSGKSIHMPWLEVAILCTDKSKNGKIVGHEGRHRAAALMNTGHVRDLCFPVAILLKEDGRWSKYYEETHEPKYSKRFLGRQDIPPLFKGQFRSTSVSIPPSLPWKSFYPSPETASLSTINNYSARLRSLKNRRLP